MAVLVASKTATIDRESTVRSPLAVKNVLFATDFSPTSEAALPYAVAICRRFGSTLHAVHVLSDASLMMMSGGVDYVSMGTIYEDAHTEAKERLDEMSERIDGISHRNYVGHGQVWKSLSGLIHENGVDLVVVGTHGRTGLGKLLLGSVAEDILRHSPCPVLTVGPKVSGRAKLPEFSTGGRDLAPPELELRQILFATNFARNAALAAQDAVSLAAEFHSRLILMHVIEDYTRLGSEPGPIEDSRRRLQELIPKNAQLQYNPEFVLEFGHAPDRILRIASEREVDMIILGARSSEVGTTHLPWSAAHHVIVQAHCPVLTIRL
jgi:nucleotide-binding universal stress UspA family protein